MPRRKKQPPEDWTEEIEQWERIINDPWYNYRLMMKEMKQMEKKKLLAKNKRGKAGEPEAYCAHQVSGWFEHELICTECGEVLKTQRVQRNDVRYGFRNHIKRNNAVRRK